MLKKNDMIYVEGLGKVTYLGVKENDSNRTIFCPVCNREVTTKKYVLVSDDNNNVYVLHENCFKKNRKDDIICEDTITEDVSEQVVEEIPEVWEFSEIEQKAIDHLYRIEISRAISPQDNPVAGFRSKYSYYYSLVVEQVSKWMNGEPTGSKLNKTNINGAMKYLRRYKELVDGISFPKWL